MLGEAVDGDRDALLADGRAVTSARRTSPLTNDPAVRARAGALTPGDYDRDAPYPERRDAQRERTPLPELPTTTIGSFPQTAEIRAARRDLKAGRLDPAEYDRFMRARIAEVVAHQEHVGLDVLVHGEPERNLRGLPEHFAGTTLVRVGRRPPEPR